MLGHSYEYSENKFRFKIVEYVTVKKKKQSQQKTWYVKKKGKKKNKTKINSNTVRKVNLFPPALQRMH